MKTPTVNKPKRPTVAVIAGANGAGKSTAAPYLLKKALGILEFVNADQIALGLSAYAPETVSFEAGRIMLKRLHELAASKVSMRLSPPFPAARLLCSCADARHRVTAFRLFMLRCPVRNWQSTA